jgi:hypothetical protein
MIVGYKAYKNCLNLQPDKTNFQQVTTFVMKITLESYGQDP